MAKYVINPHTGKLDRVDDASTDTDDNGIIDKAESLDDGAGNTATASDVKDAVTKKHNTHDASAIDFTPESGDTFDSDTDTVAEALNELDGRASHTQNTDTALGQQSENLDMGTHKIVGVVDPSTDQECATKKYVDENGGGIDDIIEDTTPELGGELDCGENTIAFTEKANVVVANLVTINWKESNKQLLTVDDDVTISFTAPSNPCSLTLRIVQSGGGHTTTLPTTKTPEGEGITLSNGNGDIDIVSIYYDGTDYYAIGSLKFS